MPRGPEQHCPGASPLRLCTLVALNFDQLHLPSLPVATKSLGWAGLCACPAADWPSQVRHTRLKVRHFQSDWSNLRSMPLVILTRHNHGGCAPCHGPPSRQTLTEQVLWNAPFVLNRPGIRAGGQVFSYSRPEFVTWE